MAPRAAARCAAQERRGGEARTLVLRAHRRELNLAYRLLIALLCGLLIILQDRGSQVCGGSLEFRSGRAGPSLAGLDAIIWTPSCARLPAICTLNFGPGAWREPSVLPLQPADEEEDVRRDQLSRLCWQRLVAWHHVDLAEAVLRFWAGRSATRA